MRLTIALLSLLSLATAFPFPFDPKKVPELHSLQKRATADLANETLAEISALNSSVTDLTTAVDAFDGSLLNVISQSVEVIAAESKLDATTLKATLIVKQSSNFTDAESNSIVVALAGLITPIQTSLTALTNKYETFKSTLESPVVLLDLKVLKAHTDDLLDALSEKLTATWADYLALGQTTIGSAFDAAIAVYEG